MTELEKMQRAKMYIDNLANGINPLTNQAIPDTDIVHNVRISRCLFYVSELLQQSITREDSSAKRKNRKTPFYLSASDLKNYEISKTPLPVSEITARINQLIGDETMKVLKTTSITHWLLDLGFLEVQTDSNDKNVKRPTEAGNNIGISTTHRSGVYGQYTVVLYNAEAQQFIIDNMDSIITVNNT